MSTVGIDGGGFVAEGAQRRPGHSLACFVDVALPHQPGIGLLARQPGAPRSRAAGAVAARAVEDAVGVADGAVGRELDGTGTAVRRRHFAVADENPSTI